MATAASRSLSRDQKNKIEKCRLQISELKGEMYSTAKKAKALLSSATTEAQKKKIVPKVRKVEESFSQCYTLISKEYQKVVALDEDQADGWKTQQEDVDKIYDEESAPLLKFLAEFEDDISSRQAAGSAQAGSDLASAMHASNILSVLKPSELLTKDSTPAEFRSWQKSFKSYFAASGMEGHNSIEVQRQALLNHLSQNLQIQLREKFEAATSVFGGAGSMMSELEDHIMLRYPLLDRRYMLWNTKWKTGQSWETFCSTVRANAAEAEVSNLSADDVIAQIMLTGIGNRDTEVRKQCLKLTSPSSSDIERTGSWVLTQRATGQLIGGEGKGAKADRAEAGRAGGRGRSAGDLSRVVCNKCLEKGHLGRDCKNKRVCRNCKTPGHVAANCPKAKRSGSRGKSRSKSPKGAARRQSKSPGGGKRDGSRGRSGSKNRGARANRLMTSSEDTSTAGNNVVAARPGMARAMFQSMHGFSGEGSGMLPPVLHEGDGGGRPIGSLPSVGAADQPSAETVARAIHGGTGRSGLCGAAGPSGSRPISGEPPGGSAGGRPMRSAPAAKRKVTAGAGSVGTSADKVVKKILNAGPGPSDNLLRKVKKVTKKVTGGPPRPVKGAAAALLAGAGMLPPRGGASSNVPEEPPLVDLAMEEEDVVVERHVRRSAAAEEDDGDVVMEDRSDRYVPAIDTPFLNCKFSHSSGAKFSVLCVPDTGASKTVIDVNVLKTFGVKFVAKWDLSLTDASGGQMKVLGYVNLKCTSEHGRSTDIQALVAEGCHDKVLLSWVDLIGLGCIPDAFPYPLVPSQYHREWCRLLCSDSMKGDKSILEAEIAAAKDSIVGSFGDVLSDSLGGSVINCEPMVIHLRDGHVEPTCTYAARPIPLHYREAAECLIKELLDGGIIEPVDYPTTWCAPAHFVPKGDTGRVRLVTDFTGLNKFVKRPVHPFPTGQEILRGIQPSSKFFAKLDLIHGYFQVPLSEESRDYCTFLLPSGLNTGSGRYRYCRGPMGLNATGDVFCCVTDEALRGLPLDKLVDDCLIQADCLADLVSKLTDILMRCRERGIKVSLRKFVMGTSVPFAGMIVTSEGVKADPKMTEAIRHFPQPKNVTDLRSFFGLANQLAAYLPDMMQVTVHMRELLKKKVEFNWTEAHQKEFDLVRQLLCSTTVVKPFDPSLETKIITDASKLHGLGYVLLQYGSDEKPRMIKCGSTSLTDAQTRYSTVELEALGVQYAVSHCSHYLLGCDKFQVVTDHNPLIGVFSKPLREIANNRLQRLREKLSDYNFEVVWVPGKLNCIADALSRYPVFSGDATDLESSVVRAVRISREEPSLKFLFLAIDTDYRHIVKALREGVKLETLPSTHPARPYRNIWSRLSLLDGKANTLMLLDGDIIVVPRGARDSLLRKLHFSHAGYQKTLLQAKENYFWPNMANNIKQLCEKCEVCTALLPSKSHKPNLGGTEATLLEPMDEVSCDLYHINDAEWLIMVDRVSGYFLTKKLPKTRTIDVIKVLKSWFNLFGWPLVLRSDNGPQFRTEFSGWCVDNNIIHKLSSAYHHESAGLAESAVKQAKHLIEKCTKSGEDWEQAMQDWLCTPNVHSGVRPAFLFLKRTPRSRVPHVAKDGDWQEARQAREDSMCKGTQPASKFEVGDRVICQNPHSNRWTDFGVISEVRDTNQSFYVTFGDGSKKLRNVRFIRPDTVSGHPRSADTALRDSDVISRPTRHDANGIKDVQQAQDGILQLAGRRRSPRLQQKADKEVQFKR